MNDTALKETCKRIDKDVRAVMAHYFDEQTADVWELSSNAFAAMQKQRKTLNKFADFIHDNTFTHDGVPYA